MQFIKPIPFDEAVDRLGSKSLIGSRLNSEEWGNVPVGLRDRAFFSSQVENVRFLQRARNGLLDWQKAATERVSQPDGASGSALKLGSRSDFVAQMREFAQAEGMDLVIPERDRGGLKDIISERRLGLIFDTQTASAYNYGFWKQGQDPAVLDEFPAQRFIREVEVREPRDLHHLHEGEVHLKSDLGFWKGLNKDFGVPWGPWGWGCGHDVEDVDRATAERMGLLTPADQPQPAELPFNEELHVSTQHLDPDLQDWLKDAFGPQIRIRDDAAWWVGTAKPARRPARAVKPDSERPAVAVPAADSRVELIRSLGLDAKDNASADDMRLLLAGLREDSPVKAKTKVAKLAFDRGLQRTLKHVTRERVMANVQEFLNMVPSEVVDALPQITVEVKTATPKGWRTRRMAT